MAAEYTTGSEGHEWEPQFDDPSKELFGGSDSPVGLWVRKAMSREVVPVEETISGETWKALVELRVPEALKMGIKISVGVADQPPYIHASAEQETVLRERTKTEAEALIAADPVAQASTELTRILLGASEDRQGYVYDLLIEMTRWAAAEERRADGSVYALQAGNDAVKSGFLGQLELFLAAKGLKEY